MNITFVLPHLSPYPVGGFKVVYEHANRLSRRGHHVSVIHSRWQMCYPPLAPYAAIKQDVFLKTKGAALNLHAPCQIPWFALDDAVRAWTVPDLRAKFIPDGDAVVATAFHTASWVNSYPARKGRPFHLIQHNETWDGSESQASAVWRLPTRKIVIARWLREMAGAWGDAKAAYIPNGLDHEVFRVTEDSARRSPKQVAMLYHPSLDWKGSADGVRALDMARALVPDLEAVFFSTFPRPSDLPAWIDYRYLPTPTELVRLYNESAVFLHPSWSEGLPAPPAEAMACGCAVVAAANSGVQDYVAAGETGLLAPVRRPDLLADCLTWLLQNDYERRRLAANGQQAIQPYCWEQAADRMEQALSTA